MERIISTPHLVARGGIEAGTRQASVFAIGISFIVIILGTMILRMYVRLAVIKAVGADDILMLVGSIFTFGLSIASMFAAWYGVGKHSWDIDQEDMMPMLKAIYSTRVIYVVAMMCVKMSLLVFYLRLDHRPLMRWIVYGLMAAVMVLSIASFFILAFSCFPPSMFWDVTGTVKGKCMNPVHQQAFYDANGILNIITDVAIYIAPIPMLWNIQIPRRQKIAVFSIFALGFFAVAAGCVRFAYVRLLANNPTDLYYPLADSLNWCSLEIYVAIFCGSASTFKKLLKQYFPRLFSSTGASGGENGYSGGYNNSSGNGRSQNQQHPLHHLSGRSRDAWHRTTITSSNMKSHGRDHSGYVKSDGESEEAIMPVDGDIVMTKEVRTEVSRR